MNRLRTVGIALAAVVFWIGSVHSQDVPGRISGRVLKQGKGVGGVTIVVQETKEVTVTDAQGRYAFADVPAGSYALTFTLGNNVVTRTDVGVSAGLTTELEVEVDWEVGLSETLTVYSASKRIEKIVDAPAAVTVVPEEQIAVQASQGQLPKILEFTPGAEVTQSGLYDFNFNTRGFNSSLNRRVAVFLDGRDLAAPFLGAQEWSALSTPLDDLASVEFIRGPSAALYGQNSSSGVVNMISKAPRDSQGGSVRYTAGELETSNLDFRWADSLGKDWYFKFLAGIRDSEDFTVSRTETVDSPQGLRWANEGQDVGQNYSRPCSSDELLNPTLRDTPCLPLERLPVQFATNEIHTGSLRFDKYLSDDHVLTMEGGYGNIVGPVFQTGIGRVTTRESQRPWARVGYSAPHWNALAYYSRRKGDQVSLQSTADIFTDSKKYSVELQTNWDFAGGRGRIVGGGSYIDEKIDTAAPDGEQTLLVEPVATDRQSLFAQLDWRFNEKLKLVLAGREDWNTLHDPQFSPKAALVYSVHPNHTVRFTYNRAFQVANYSEFFLYALVTQTAGFAFLENLCESVGETCGFEELPVYARGNSDLGLETTEGWEVGYSAILGKKAFLTIDYYNAVNKDFITDLLPQIGTPLGPSQDSGAAGAPRGECRAPGVPYDCCTGPGEGTCTPLNPAVPAWVSPEEYNNIEVAPGLSLGQALENSFTFLGALNGVQVSNSPVDGDTIVIARSYTNFGEVETQGVDVGLNLYLTPEIDVQFAYSWFDWEPQEDDADLLRLLLPNTPEHKFSVGMSYRTARWGAGFNGRWSDKFPWTAGIFEGPIAHNVAYTNDSSSYWTLDANAHYKLGQQWTLGVNLANALQEMNYQAFGGDILGRRALLYGQYDW